MKSKEIDPKEVLIEIDPISTPKITNGVFDQDTRELRFTVVGDGEVEIFDFDIKGIWLPDDPETFIDRTQFVAPDFPSPLSRTIMGGGSARLLTFERNRFDIERVFSVRVTCNESTYEPEGEHSPPRMVVPRKR